ncbi:hypothetical protein LTR53_008816 [Teratosphaeriaceae sp. CCFEE 6253]|nr:hypothetical protein LTR53_008816 [Teratosphaeriaceae sp. CCFEE 6253]
MAKCKKRKLNVHSNPHPAPAKQQQQSGPAARNAAPMKPKPIVPFHDEDRILLVGEGDFSFAKSIVEQHGCYQVVATCYDSREELHAKYDPQAEQHTTYLEEQGQTVLYGINAAKLDRTKQLLNAGPQWDVIVFNFPHVRFNQELLVSFFKAAMSLMTEDGTVVVTLFEGEPYDLWNVRDLARHSGLEVQRSFKFAADVYPGYSHARTLGNIDGGGGWKGENRDARSYVFQRPAAATADQSFRQRALMTEKKRQRKADAESSDDDG